MKCIRISAKYVRLSPSQKSPDDENRSKMCVMLVHCDVILTFFLLFERDSSFFSSVKSSEKSVGTPTEGRWEYR